MELSRALSCISCPKLNMESLYITILQNPPYMEINPTLEMAKFNIAITGKNFHIWIFSHTLSWIILDPSAISENAAHSGETFVLMRKRGITTCGEKRRKLSACYGFCQ